MDIFKEYNFTESEVKQHVIFLSDRGPNIRYGLIRAGFVRLTCYAHIIHNLIMCMMEEQAVKDILTLCSRLCSYVKNCGLNSQLKTSLKLYTTTRWNSIYTMIDSIISNYQEVYELLIAKQRLINEARLGNGQQPDNSLSELVTNLPLSKMVQIRDFLHPFTVRIL